MSEVITLTAAPSPHQLHLTEPGEYQIILAEPGTEAHVHATFNLTGKDAMELRVIIHHQAPHTRATTTLKGVVRDQASLKIMGRIIIDPECGDTNSFLTEKILLLSDQARAEAVPDLEILTDDVKCSHAATISRIPESQLFYLMSRGLTREQAEELVVEGFLNA